MKFCTNCGNPLEDTAKFCPGCGAPCTPAADPQAPAGAAAETHVSAPDRPVEVAAAPQAAEPVENKPQSKQGRTAFIFALTCVLAIPGFIISLIDVVKNDKRYRHGLAIAALIISGIMIAACVIGIASCNAKAKEAAAAKEDVWAELLREELAREEADSAAKKEAAANAAPAPTAAPTQAPTPVPTQAPTPVPTEAPKTTAENKEMRDFVDQYEKFVDGYIAFMQNYNASNLNDLMKLTNMMGELAELEEKALKWQDTDLSTADAAYLAEAMLRIESKLLKVLY